MLPKRYDDVDINGNEMSEPRISLSDDPYLASIAIINVLSLEKARLLGERYITIVVFKPKKVINRLLTHYSELKNKIFDASLTHEYWYRGTLDMERVGELRISTALKDRTIVSYKNYGTLGKVTLVTHKPTELVTIKEDYKVVEELKRGASESKPSEPQRPATYVSFRMDHESANTIQPDISDTSIGVVCRNTFSKLEENRLQGKPGIMFDVYKHGLGFEEGKLIGNVLIDRHIKKRKLKHGNVIPSYSVTYLDPRYSEWVK